MCACVCVCGCLFFLLPAIIHLTSVWSGSEHSAPSQFMTANISNWRHIFSRPALRKILTTHHYNCQLNSIRQIIRACVWCGYVRLYKYKVHTWARSSVYSLSFFVFSLSYSCWQYFSNFSLKFSPYSISLFLSLSVWCCALEKINGFRFAKW